MYDFEITPDFIRELNEQARIDVDVMRHLLISVPEGYTYIKYKEEAQVMEEERPRKRKMSSHTYPGASSVAPAPVLMAKPAPAEGVAAPETANNAATGGSMVSLLSLGIPANVVMAVLLGAFIIHGIQPFSLL